MPDQTSARIRWQTVGGSLPGFLGTVGTLDPAPFRVYDPEHPGGEHTLCCLLPGLENRTGYGTEAEVKAQAEEWLSEFIASVGAMFQPAPEWGIRFTIGDPREHPANDEADARAVLANMREAHPEWNAELLTRSRAIPAGPWTVAEDNANQQQEGNADA